MIHAQNVLYYDIESRLEERLECRFQETTESGDTVTVRKSATLLLGLVNLHNLKRNSLKENRNVWKWPIVNHINPLCCVW